MTTLHIDIVSDIACPWCAIGYARLEQAMDQVAGECNFTVSWHPFELNPDKDADGEPILQALSRKYGRSPEEMEKAQNDMAAIAHELGLNFEHMQERYTRNTFNAHRLVMWAGEQNRQTEMKKAFFEAYFGRAADISDDGVLLECVAAIGLDTGEARRVLDEGDFAEAVRKEEAYYQKAGISAVPAYVINQQYLISGAQEPDYLVQAFRDIQAGTAA
ncbi:MULTISPECIES: DsbA family oxidoreductase [Halomonadaceae]|uniref:DsbA family oxidoreductase n=1 Tax=Vreelandella halophila TaxID=86177 RepID=A0A9X4YDG4_9GAMM|nr:MULTISPECIES: DsbA family oxidoreductase [Halomonas]MYL27273.1 DsbA family oxidoreductase [Halomonas utahensis]MYL74475.1 DsbA family oxidoreductase [Halomonas sp. 22501_18_FS]